jgi:hypothetical protein
VARYPLVVVLIVILILSLALTGILVHHPPLIPDLSNQMKVGDHVISQKYQS